MSGLGRVEPPDWEHVQKYPHVLSAIGAYQAPAVVETNLRLRNSLRPFYNQGQEGACVGFSQCIQISVYDQSREGFDGFELYHAAQKIDGMPIPHEGSTVRAGFEITKTRGPKEVMPNRMIDQSDEVTAYFWCTSMDDVRTAFAAGRVVVWGINWYSNFDKPVKNKKTGEFWIGKSKNLGYVRGGHAICSTRWSDQRQAFEFTNSWGTNYPRVWVPISVGQRLLQEGGECGYGVPKGTS